MGAPSSAARSAGRCDWHLGIVGEHWISNPCSRSPSPRSTARQVDSKFGQRVKLHNYGKTKTQIGKRCSRAEGIKPSTSHMNYAIVSVVLARKTVVEFSALSQRFLRSITLQMMGKRHRNAPKCMEKRGNDGFPSFWNSAKQSLSQRVTQK